MTQLKTILIGAMCLLGTVMSAALNDQERALFRAVVQYFVDISEERVAQIQDLAVNPAVNLNARTTEGGNTILHCILRGRFPREVVTQEEANILFVFFFLNENALTRETVIAGLVAFFLDSGAPVNARNTHRNQPLHFAVRFGHEEAVRRLLGRGAHVNARNRRGDTPLHLAARPGWVNGMLRLLQVGADPAARNNQGEIARNNHPLRLVPFHTARVQPPQATYQVDLAALPVIPPLAGGAPDPGPDVDLL